MSKNKATIEQAVANLMKLVGGDEKAPAPVGALLGIKQNLSPVLFLSIICGAYGFETITKSQKLLAKVSSCCYVYHGVDSQKCLSIATKQTLTRGLTFCCLTFIFRLR